MTGIDKIALERKEQIEKHGRTILKDLQTNQVGQLREAAEILIKPVIIQKYIEFPPEGWDKGIWTNMATKPFYDRFIIAGALIAAEIDRLDNLHLLDEQNDRR